MKIENDELIKKWEKLRLVAYLPTKYDVWTIGWGHTLGVKQGDKITEAEAQAFFEQDTDWVEKAIKELVKVPLNQYQYDALASLIFNIGRTQFSNSTLLRKLNAKDYQGAADQFLVWNKQNGKTLSGLVKRRTEEREYFLQESIVEGPSSASVDPVDKLTGVIKSKEVVGGAVAALTGAGSFLGSLDSSAQQILSAGLSVALVAFGLFFIWNRINARKKGER